MDWECAVTAKRCEKNSHRLFGKFASRRYPQLQLLQLIECEPAKFNVRLAPWHNSVVKIGKFAFSCFYTFVTYPYEISYIY